MEVMEAVAVRMAAVRAMRQEAVCAAMDQQVQLLQMVPVFLGLVLELAVYVVEQTAAMPVALRQICQQ